MPEYSQPSDFVVREFPARIADLAFRIAVPHDWNLPELPPEEVDFESPAAFFPLMLAIAPWAAVVLSVVARPGFENGTLQDWSLFLLDSQGFRPTAFAPAAIGNVQGLVGIGRQQQEDTWLEVRFAFFEDGGRLVLLGLLAPEAISAPLAGVWKAALQSFALESPQGATVPVGPGLGFMPEPSPEAVIVADERLDTVVEAPESAEAEEMPADPIPQSSPFAQSDLGYYAKADDTSTFDPEHPINARLRDQGVGLTPNLLEDDSDGKCARLGAGALRALIRVAYGWHVIDDGRRTLVLDPDGKIQISLNVMQKNGRSIDQMLDELQAEAEESYPHPEFLRLQHDGISALAIRKILADGEPVEQIHMLTAWATESAMLRARVTADPPSMGFAADYADLILKSADYGKQEEGAMDSSQESHPEWPAWAHLADRLEREDRLEEAEAVIKDGVPSLHFAIATAHMYRQRWLRLLESEPAKASEARQKAADWAYNYASYATSGGEGVALSRERDEFLRTLGPEPLE